MVERKTLNLVVVGSIPTGGAFWITGLCTVRVWFGHNGNHMSAFLAQMVERWPFKPMVAGSIPAEGVFEPA